MKEGRENQFGELHPAAEYDSFSDFVGRTYERSTAVMADRLKEIAPDTEEILEIGSGTGNSALRLFEEFSPKDINITGVEKGSFAYVADAKRKGNIKQSNNMPKYSLEAQKRFEPYKDNFRLVRAAGERLPFKDGSFDAVFMCQSFHWLTPEKALQEAHRVLEREGVLVFDESSAHFDFSDSKEGREFMECDKWDHPFGVSIQKNFDHELKELEIQLSKKPFALPEEVLYSFESLKDLLEKEGFELVPNASGHLYTTTFIPIPHDRIIQVLETGARMCIDSDVLETFSAWMKQNPERAKKWKNAVELADYLVSIALEKAKDELKNNEILPQDREYGDTIAAFVARRVEVSHEKEQRSA